MMNVLIAADIEGISGAVHWDQVNAKHTEYARFRKLMMVRGIDAAPAFTVFASFKFDILAATV